jgi:hypothetical protein
MVNSHFPKKNTLQAMKEDLKQEHEYLVLFARVILPNRDLSHKGLRKVEFFWRRE